MKNQANTSQPSNKGPFSLRNGVLSAALGLTILLGSCGKQTKQDIVELQKNNKQTEQIDGLQKVRLTEHTKLIKDIISKLGEHGVKIENMDSLNAKQTEAISELYKKDVEFKEQIDELNLVIGKCCDANVEKTSKKEPAKKEPVKEKPVKKDNDKPTKKKKDLPKIEDDTSKLDLTKKDIPSANDSIPAHTTDGEDVER